MVKSKILRIVCIILGFIFLGIGVVGIVFPIIPTTPFLLLTSFFFMKGSKRFNDLYISNNELYKSNSDYSFKISLEKEFIKIYLECNGRINKISDKMFIHKNTVHYKLKKIEEILDCDLSRYDIKMYIIIAVMSS